MMRSSYVMSIFFLALLTSCLKTRADLRHDAVEEPVAQRPVRQVVAQNDQKSARPAPPTVASRFEEYDEQMRQLNGRTDEIENGLKQMSAQSSNEKSERQKERYALEQRLNAYEEAIKKLEAQVAALSEDVVRLKTPPPPPPAPAVATNSSGKGRTAYDEGEELFNKKNYKEAIVHYQRYRDSFPKGKMYGEATYKMGLSFQELGLKDEARAFFEEVTAKFPGSGIAKKAAAKMKSLK